MAKADRARARRLQKKQEEKDASRKEVVEKVRAKKAKLDQLFPTTESKFEEIENKALETTAIEELKMEKEAKFAKSLPSYSCTFEEINKVLEDNKYFIITLRKPNSDDDRRISVYIDETATNLNVYCRHPLRKNVFTRFSFRYDGRTDPGSELSGAEAYKALRKIYQFKELTKDENSLIEKDAEVAMVGYNKLYNNTRTKAYIYDINSCYASILADKIPDFYKKPKSGIVGNNEIGFTMDGHVIFEGFAFQVYPLIDSPLKSEINKLFLERRDIKNSNPVRAKYIKNLFNYGIGMFVYKNKLYRNYIIAVANRKIQSLLSTYGPYILHYNTDSVVSTVPIKELPIGENLGEWKCEYVDFAYKGFVYQKNLEKPTYRGISDFKFKKDWDLLKDEIPNKNNHNLDPFIFDLRTMKVYINNKNITQDKIECLKGDIYIWEEEIGICQFRNSRRIEF